MIEQVINVLYSAYANFTILKESKLEVKKIITNTKLISFGFLFFIKNLNIKINKENITTIDKIKMIFSKKLFSFEIWKFLNPKRFYI